MPEKSHVSNSFPSRNTSQRKAGAGGPAAQGAHVRAGPCHPKTMENRAQKGRACAAEHAALPGAQGLFPLFCGKSPGKGRFFQKTGQIHKKRGPARVFADGPNKERGKRRRVPDHPGEGRPRCFLYTPYAVQVTFQTLSALQYCESFLLTSSDPWEFSVKKTPFPPLSAAGSPIPLQGSNCLFMPSRL